MSNDRTSSEYIGYRLEVFLGVLVPVQIVLVALRFYARSLTASCYGLDDWLVVTSLLGQVLAAGMAIEESSKEKLTRAGSVEHGAVGYHLKYLEETNPGAVTIFFKYLVAFSVWYHVTIGLSKLAICVMYRRLFPQRSVLIVLYITAGILISTSIASLIADLAACRPFSANWAPLEVWATHCISKQALFVWSTLPNILTDVVLLILPLPIIWRLHASIQLKVPLTVTFVIGGMGLVVSILRFLTFTRNGAFTDATYTAVELIIWTNAEPGIYLISACMLMYRPLLEKIKIKINAGSPNRNAGRSATDRSGSCGSHFVWKDYRRHRVLEDSERGIALRNKDVNDGQNQHRLPRGGITVTTHIQQYWEDT
ncbi:hypothetical protein AAE478_004594 [Parahypoxylon ruwenzoriense]